MTDLGFSSCMGPRLRRFVERQLLQDLTYYLKPEIALDKQKLIFDWSESCIEGHRTAWLDGELENFSGIVLRNDTHSPIAEGWMDFIETEGALLVFWWFLRGFADGNINPKTSNDVPFHIWQSLSEDAKEKWHAFAPSEVGG